VVCSIFLEDPSGTSGGPGAGGGLERLSQEPVTPAKAEGQTPVRAGCSVLCSQRAGVVVGAPANEKPTLEQKKLGSVSSSLAMLKNP
jgi:hypothetical protein